MTYERMQRLVATLSVLLAVSCSSKEDQPPPPPPPPAPSFDGTWVDCSNDGSSDMRDVITIAGSNVDVVSFTYATADGSCGGAGTAAGTPVSSAMTLGTPADAWLGNLVVQATPVDLAWTPTYYTIVWRDADVDPNVLYTGDDGGKIYGGTPDTRPNALQTWRLRYQQTTPSAADLNGTWIMACKNNGATDEHEELTISGSTLSSSTTAYSSIDGTCTGTVTSTSSHTGTFTVGNQVYSTLATMTVTALAIDIPDATKPAYTVMWVDKRVIPNVLYVGIGEGTPTVRTTVLNAGKPMVKQ